MWKGGDADVWNFGGAVGELKKKFWHFGLNGVAVAGSDWDVDNREIVLTEGRFDLSKENRGGDMIKDDCDKHDDDDNSDDNNDDNMSCNVSIINFENLMFSFSIRKRWSLWYSSTFNELCDRVQRESWCMRVILLNFSQ